MKVIFLDVDGVLNTFKLIRKFGMDFIDDICVALVARIVRETGAKIVLSSTWRIEEDARNLVVQALKNHNLEIHDCTPVLQPKDCENWVRRSEEIQAWLDKNPVDKFAIVDDFDDACIEGSFFQTHEDVGLTVAIAEKVIEHLQ